MSDQIVDTLIYQEYEYPLLAVKGTGLASPQHFGIEPEVVDKWCMRGYYLRYLCCEGELYLNEMTVKAQNGVYPEIAGIRSFVALTGLFVTRRYADLKIPVPFTGSLIIGKEFRRDGGEIHLEDWQCYRVFFELFFEKGRLLKVIDCSDKMKGPFLQTYDFEYTRV